MVRWVAVVTAGLRVTLDSSDATIATSLQIY